MKTTLICASCGAEHWMVEIEDEGWQRRMVARLKAAERDKFEALVQVVAETFGIQVAEVKGRSRAAPIVLARHATVYLSALCYGWSMNYIAKVLGKKDHGAACNSYRRCRDLMDVDPKYKSRVELCRSKINLTELQKAA